ncbi:MAG: DinB family protein [Vicinamibacterales bacterium]
MTYYGGKELAASFRTVRKNTIQIALDIPEDQYGFKATPDVDSVASMLAHVAVSTHWAHRLHGVDKKTYVSFEDFGAYMAESADLQKALLTKTDIVAALTANGERFAAWLESLTDADLGEKVSFPPPVEPPSRTRFEMLLGIKEHEMHHRAKLMLIERLLGIVPHLTRQRQQR